MLETWIDANCQRGEPSPPTKIVRQYLTDMGQSIDESSINGTICQLFYLGLLDDQPNKPEVQTVLMLT